MSDPKETMVRGMNSNDIPFLNAPVDPVDGTRKNPGVKPEKGFFFPFF
jgi:hypothetical protein